jgi:endo-1,3(4)-beta-glucanase
LSIFPTAPAIHVSAPLSPTILPNRTSVHAMAASSNIFVPVASGAPPPSLPPRGGHPVPGVGITGGHASPIETNKFYTNFMVGDQSCNVFTYPYSLRWIVAQGLIGQWGFGTSHVERSQEVFGTGSPASCTSFPFCMPLLMW